MIISIFTSKGGIFDANSICSNTPKFPIATVDIVFNQAYIRAKDKDCEWFGTPIAKLANIHNLYVEQFIHVA